ncbi:MAG: 2-C-methyl-D-erythritol 2,4-cyclodiphosphate synthase [Fibrobacterota bacterium]
MIKTGIGQDSHRFCDDSASKPLIMGGVEIPGAPGLSGNSDGDVVLHAVTNGISGITGIPVLGAKADTLCLTEGVTDSAAYLNAAVQDLQDYTICHISISIEAKAPKLLPHIDRMRESIAGLCNLSCRDVAITATTGEGLTDFGRGLGIQVFCSVTALSNAFPHHFSVQKDLPGSVK